MKICDVEFYLVEVPASGVPPVVRALLVRLATDSPAEGWGESRVSWRPDEIAARRDALLPVLAARSIFEIEEMLRLDALKNRPLAAALEMACWDLVGKTAQQPLCHLAGGVYRRQIPLAARLPAAGADEVGQVARQLSEQGFHAQIVTATGVVQDDLDVLRAVCEAVGERVEVRLDARRSFTPDVALQICHAAEDLRLQHVLDPLKTNDLERTASLQRLTSVPLATSAIERPADVLAVVRSRAASSVVVDLRKVGGLSTVRRCAAVAEAAQIGMLLGGGPALGIATAAVLQLAAGLPSLAGANESAYHHLQDDVLSEPLEVVDGMLTVPQAPGLGVGVDRAKVERYQIG